MTKIVTVFKRAIKIIAPFTLLLSFSASADVILHAFNWHYNEVKQRASEIKNAGYEFKIKIIETLWSIIYSNNEADMYETNLMRRLSGLLYIDNKTMGAIKEKIKKNSTQ